MFGDCTLSSLSLYSLFKYSVLNETSKIFFDEKRNGWIVPSQNSNKKYFVFKNSHSFECDCPDCQFRKVECKHTHAVKYYLQVEKENSEGEKETEKVPLTYKQAWKAYNEAQTDEVRQFDELLSDLVQNIEEPEQKRGKGRPSLSLREKAFCSIQKVYSQLSSRRASSLFRFAMDREQISHAPHFNVVNNFLKDENSTELLERLVAITAQPLRTVETEFAVDSSGFRVTGFNEYHNQKHNGGSKKHSWLKAHICVGVKTNIVTGIVITREYGGDSPQFEPLVRWASRNGFTIDEVSADMAYSSRDNLEVVEELGGIPYIARLGKELHQKAPACYDNFIKTGMQVRAVLNILKKCPDSSGIFKSVTDEIEEHINKDQLQRALETVAKFKK